MDFPPGAIVDRDFELESLAGRGSFSTVYRARQLSRKSRIVAVKILHRGIQHQLHRQSGYHRNPYLKEQLLCQRLRDQAVCRVLKVGATDEGRYYVAMEWADGITLDRHMKRYTGGMPMQDVADVLEQLGRAVAEMHGSRVIHRDLKPDNLMLKELPSGRLSLKILDFGIAKLLDEDDVIDTDTQFLVGTPAYMSPEQAAGKFTDPRSDIFSVAAVAYEMLTGRRHIDFDTPHRTAEDYVTHLLSEAPLPTCPARERRPDLPGEIDEAISEALSRDWNRRPERIEMFTDDMAVTLRAYGPRRVPVGLFKRTWRKFRKG